jgi:erythromycin esterase
LNSFLENNIVLQNMLWLQIIESFKSAVLIYKTHKSKGKGIPIRDTQMAKNLSFLVKKLSDKKIIVWTANINTPLWMDKQWVVNS